MVPGKAVPPRPNYDYFVRKVIDSRIQTAVCGVPECGDSETLNYGKAVPSLVLGTKSGQNVQMVHMITLVHSCVYLPGTSASQIIKCHVCDPRREHASELPLDFSLHLSDGVRPTRGQCTTIHHLSHTCICLRALRSEGVCSARTRAHGRSTAWRLLGLLRRQLALRRESLRVCEHARRRRRARA